MQRSRETGEGGIGFGVNEGNGCIEDERLWLIMELLRRRRFTVGIRQIPSEESRNLSKISLIAAEDRTGSGDMFDSSLEIVDFSPSEGNIYFYSRESYYSAFLVKTTPTTLKSKIQSHRHLLQTAMEA